MTPLTAGGAGRVAMIGNIIDNVTAPGGCWHEMSGTELLPADVPPGCIVVLSDTRPVPHGGGPKHSATKNQDGTYKSKNDNVPTNNGATGAQAFAEYDAAIRAAGGTPCYKVLCYDCP